MFLYIAVSSTFRAFSRYAMEGKMSTWSIVVPFHGIPEFNVKPVLAMNSILINYLLTETKEYEYWKAAPMQNDSCYYDPMSDMQRGAHTGIFNA